MDGALGRASIRQMATISHGQTSWSVAPEEKEFPDIAKEKPLVGFNGEGSVFTQSARVLLCEFFLDLLCQFGRFRLHRRTISADDLPFLGDEELFEVPLHRAGELGV